MKAIVAMAVVLLFAWIVRGSPAGELGLEMADTHSQFAPLYALYDVYAEYLFVGDRTYGLRSSPV